MATVEVSAVSFEDLALIEDEFEQIDTEIMRQQYQLSKSVFAKRTEVVSKIPSFWALVLEQAPPEVDGYIHPEDSRILGESLLNIEVTRPELESADSATRSKASPKTLHIKFEFKPNDYFSDAVLEKKFWYRHASDGWMGLVSEPVKINWKKGKDLSDGLTDGAVALWEARKKAGDMMAKGLSEYTALAKKVEHWNGANTSLFTWFGFVSGRRWVSAEESENAIKDYEEKRDARKAGKKVDEQQDDDDDEEDKNDDSEVEVFEAGDDLAVSFAEDIWPNAIKFFTQAQEVEEVSDMGFEDMEEDADERDEEPELVDIRSLVADKGGKKNGRSDGAPPQKKQKN